MEDDRRHRKFLIIQTASLGDVVLATSLIETLHASYPKARIDFLVKKGCEQLLTGHPYISQLLVWDKKQFKYRKLFKLLKHIRGEHYDVLIDVHRFASSGFLAAFSKARMILGFTKNPFSLHFTHHYPHYIGKDGSMHEIERNHQLIQTLVQGPAARPKLYPGSENFKHVEAYKHQPYITISPMSLWFTKQYPTTLWAKFIKEVPPHIHIFLLGSSSDKGALDVLVTEAVEEQCTNLASELNLLQTAALMQDALMNFTNDSAPLHVASAMDAPLTAVFCSTVTAFGFGPLGDHSLVVETAEPLHCRPCGIHGLKACPEKNMACATTISKQQLIDRIPND